MVFILSWDAWSACSAAAISSAVSLVIPVRLSKILTDTWPFKGESG